MKTGLSNINTLIFDFDGTLANTMDLGIKIINKLAIKYRFKKISSDEELKHYRNMKTQDAIKEIGISKLQIPIIANQFRRELNKEIMNLRPFDGVQDMLKQLAHKYLMGIVTSNSSKNIHKFLLINKLENHFGFFSTGISLFNKDANIRSILKKNSLERDQVLFIGDETRDIEAARNVGIKVMAISWGFQNKALLENFQPDFIADSPSNVLSLLS